MQTNITKEENERQNNNNTEPTIPSILSLINLESLLINEPLMEQALNKLTMDQLNSIEKLVIKVKRNKRNNQQNSHSKNNNNNNNTKSIASTPKGNILEEVEEDRRDPNLPTTFYENGIEHMSFNYTSRGIEKRITIRIDVETINDPTLSFEASFLTENCLYPRAFCTKEEYKGNRWDYETMCNDVGWKLAILNPDVLQGKRGLLQRAVDSYRNRLPGMQSRRIARQEKMLNGTLRKRVTPTVTPQNSNQLKVNLHKEVKDNNSLIELDKLGLENNQSTTNTFLEEQEIPLTFTLPIYFQNHPQIVTFNADIEKIALEQIDDSFKLQHTLYPRALPQNQQSNKPKRKKLEFEVLINEIGWKLAFLNKEVLQGNLPLLQRVTDRYRTLFTHFVVRPYRERLSFQEEWELLGDENLNWDAWVV